MRAPVGYGRRTLLGPLMITLVAVFVVDQVLAALFNVYWLREWLVLGGMDLASGQIWRLLTYGALHGGLLHLGMNLLGLWLIGRMVESLFGGKRLLEVFLVGVVAGGLFWTLVNFGKPAYVVGSSAGLMAVISVWARERWFDRAMLLPIPIEMPVRWLYWGLIGLNVFSLLVHELPGGRHGGVAASAHLGGLAAGWLWARWRAHHGPERGPSIEPPAWLRRRRPQQRASPSFKLDLQSPRDLRAEVDRILDKINAQGFGSLTPAERDLLDRAKDVLKH